MASAKFSVKLWKSDGSRFGVIVDGCPDDVVGLFDGAWREAEIVDEDGDVVMYCQARGDLEPQFGERGKDVGRLDELPFDAALKALRKWTLWGRQHPPVLLKSPRLYGHFCYFDGRLAYRFFKKGGYVPHFAPVTVEEAVALVERRKVFKYIKSSSSFRLVDAA
jgi:hypothetical protein